MRLKFANCQTCLAKIICETQFAANFENPKIQFIKQIRESVVQMGYHYSQHNVFRVCLAHMDPLIGANRLTLKPRLNIFYLIVSCSEYLCHEALVFILLGLDDLE